MNVETDDPSRKQQGTGGIFREETGLILTRKTKDGAEDGGVRNSSLAATADCVIPTCMGTLKVEVQVEL